MADKRRFPDDEFEATPPNPGLTRRRVMGLTMASTTSLILRPAFAAAGGLVAVRRAYAACRFGQLHYRVATPRKDGKTPLLCFHSSPNSGRIYEKFLAEMGMDRLTIAADTPGFGDSDPPPVQPTIGDYAASMFDLIKQLGLGAVDVMGYHTGSKVAVALARTHPELVRRLVMVSAPVYTQDELDSQKTHFAPVKLTEDGSHLTRTWLAHVRWAMHGWTVDDVAVQFPDAVRRPDISWWGHQAAFNFDMGSQLPEVVQPVLVLNPEDDLHEPTKRAQRLLKNGQYHALPDWGHGFLDIHTAQAGAYVRSFLGTPA